VKSPATYLGGEAYLSSMKRKSFHARRVQSMINYSLLPSDDGYTLTIWENAPLTANRISPFLFKASYHLRSPLDALGILKLFQRENVSLCASVPGQLASALLRYSKRQRAEGRRQRGKD
jgi:hypothetical protein